MKKVIQTVGRDLALVWRGFSYRIVKDRDYVLAERHQECGGGHMFSFVSVEHPAFPSGRFSKRFVRGTIECGGFYLEPMPPWCAPDSGGSQFPTVHDMAVIQNRRAPPAQGTRGSRG